MPFLRPQFQRQRLHNIGISNLQRHVCWNDFWWTRETYSRHRTKECSLLSGSHSM